MISLNSIDLDIKSDLRLNQNKLRSASTELNPFIISEMSFPQGCEVKGRFSRNTYILSLFFMC